MITRGSRTIGGHGIHTGILLKIRISVTESIEQSARRKRDVSNPGGDKTDGQVPRVLAYLVSLRTPGYTENLHIREYRLGGLAWMRICGEPSNGVRLKMQTRARLRACACVWIHSHVYTVACARTSSLESYIKLSLHEIETWVTRITVELNAANRVH